MMPPLIPNKQVLNPTEQTKAVIINTTLRQETEIEEKNQLKTTNNTKQPTNTQSSVRENTNTIQLPSTIRQALTQITQSFTQHQPLSRLLAETQLQSLTDTKDAIASLKSEQNNISKADSLINQLFRYGAILTGNPAQWADQLKTAIRHYNTGITEKTQQNWKEALERIIEQESNTSDTKKSQLTLAQKWLTRSGHDAFMQQLQLNAGNPVLFQDIPFYMNDQWRGAYVEIEQSTSDNTLEPEWKLQLQFELDDAVQISTKLVLNADQEIHVYIWTDDPSTTESFQQNMQELSNSLHDIGLLPFPIFIATGHPPQRQALQQSPLSGSVNITT